MRRRGLTRPEAVLLLWSCLLIILGWQGVCSSVTMGSGSGSNDLMRPDAVEEVNINYNITRRTLFISWTESPDPFDVNYTVSYLATARNTNLSRSEERTSMLELNIEGDFVQSGVFITVCVAAVNDFGSSPAAVSNLTIPGLFAPPPEDFTAETISSTSIRLVWNMTFDGLNPEYFLQYSIQKLTGPALTLTEFNQSLSCEMVMESDCSAGLDHLTPYSDYSFTLVAIYDGDSSGPVMSSARTFEDRPDSVENLTVNFNETRASFDPLTSMLNVTLHVSLSPPIETNGLLIGYQYNISEIDASTSLYSEDTNGTVLDLEVIVQPYTNYSVSVRASTRAGEGMARTAIDLSPEAAPQAPMNVSAVALNSTAIDVQWIPPENSFGLIRQYIISVTSESTAMNYTAGRSDRMVVIGNLIPFTEYRVVVYAVTVDIGQPSEAVDLQTLEDIPSDVSNLMASCIPAMLSVSWSEPAMPNGNVLYNLTIDSTNLATNLESSEQITLNVTDYISPLGGQYFTQFSVMVFAYTTVGSSDPVDTTCTTEQGVPSNVTNLTANCSTTSLIASWGDPVMPNGDISYNITITGLSLATNAVILPTSQVLPKNTSEFNISTEFYSRYTVTVFAETNAGAGDSVETSCETAEGIPSQILNLSALCDSTMLTVSWNEPLAVNGNVSYNLTVEGTNLATNQMTSEFPPALTATNYGMPLDSQYFIQFSVTVFAYTTAGSSNPISTICTTEQGVPGKPAAINITDITNTTASVTWQPPANANGILTNYTVELLLMGNQFTTPAVLSSSDLQFMFFNLTPYTNYIVNVFANTSAGHGESATLEFTTEIGIPSEPTILTVETRSIPRTLFINWIVPVDTNGPIVLYVVQFSIIGSNSFQSMNTSNTDLQLMNLQPYTNYSIAVQACTDAGCGPFSETSTQLTIQEAPGVPTALTVTEVTNTTVSFTWQPPNDANGIILNYTVELFDSSGIQLGPPTILSASDLQYMISDLDPFINYSVSVFATTSAGPGNSTTVEFTTAIGIPSEPTILTVETRSMPRTLFINWIVPVDTNGPIAMYVVQFSIVGSNSFQKMNTSDTDLQLMNLQPYTNYSIAVQACTVAGCGPFSGSSTQVTAEEAPGVPTALTVTEVTNTTVSFTWQPPNDANGIILNYTVELFNSSGIQLGPPTILSASDLQYMISDLDPFTNYSVSVFATTSAGPGNSTTVEFTTAIGIPSEPTILTVETRSMPRTLFINWIIPVDTNGPIVLYVVQFSIIGSNSFQKMNTSNTDLQLMNLQPYTNYSIAVQACTNAGCGPFSGFDIQLTEQEAPSAPVSVTAFNITSTSFRVTWDRPEFPNGIIINYLIDFYKTEEGAASTRCNMTGDDSQVFDLVGLDFYTDYTVTVTAETVSPGDPSAPITVLTDEDVPSSPVNFSVDVINSTAIEAFWSIPDMPNGIILFYNLSYVDIMDTFITILAIDELSDYSFVVNDLMEFTMYSLSVTASTRIGESPPSMLVTVRTDTDMASPPTFPNAMAVNSTAIELTWGYPQFPRGSISGYLIETNATEKVFNITLDTENDMGNQSFVIPNLDPFSVYSFQITAYSFSFIGTFQRFVGEEASVIGTTLPDVPSMPLTPKLDVTGPTSLTASWTPPVPANGIITAYTVYCRVSMVQFYTEQVPSDNNPFTFRATTNGITLEADISDLVAFTNYNCYVTANTSAGEGGQSETVSERTSEDAPSAPVGVAASNTSSTSVNVSWDRPEVPNGIITNYLITYYKTDEGDQMMMMNMTGDNQTQFELTQLDIYTSYTITVTAVTVSEGGPSAPITVFTDEDEPSAPTQFFAFEVNSTAIRAQWNTPDKPNGIILFYTLYYSMENGDSTESDLAIPADSSETMYGITLSGLDEFQTYLVRVTASTRIGEGDSTPIKQVQTDPASSSPPSFVEAETINSTAIILRWGYPTEPRGSIIGYLIMILPSLMDNPVNVTLDTVNDMGNQSYVFNELSPFTVYEFRVAAYSSSEGVIHNGIYTDPAVSIQTAEDVPSIPQMFMLSAAGPTSLTASWAPPVPANGMLTAYTVYCRVSAVQFYPEQDPSGENPFTVRATTDGSMLEADVSDLVAFTNYSCYVTANTSAGEGGQSETVSESTSEDAPSMPINVNAVNISSTSIRITWDRPQFPRGIITAYQVTYYRTEEGPVSAQTVDTTLTLYELPGLAIYTNYTVTVTAVTFTPGDTSGAVTVLTDESRPGAPDVFTAEALNSTAISTSWTAPSMPNGVILTYNLYYTEQDTNDERMAVVQAVQDIPSYTYTIPNLKVFTSYDLSVSAVTRIGEGDRSDPVVSIRTNPSLSSPPTFVSATVLNSTSTSLTWSYPADPRGLIQGYLIAHNTTTDGLEMVENVTLTMMNDMDNQTFIFTNLLPFTYYSFQVAAYSFLVEENQFETLQGEYSTIIVELTNEDVPTMPLMFQLATLDSTSLTASWAPPVPANGIITAYTVYCRVSAVQFYPEPDPSGENPFTVRATTDGSMLEADISDLVAFTNYSCYVTANTSAGEGGQSETVTESTSEDAPSMPINVNAVNISSTSIRITWDRPQFPRGIITAYQVTYYRTEEGPDSAQTVDTTLTLYELPGLAIYTNYTVTVTAVTLTPGDTSGAVTVLTDESRPGAPEGFTAEALNSTAISTSWTAPSMPNGVILTYNLYYTEQDTNDERMAVVQAVQDMPSYTYTIPNLKVFTSYDLSVSAVTRIGEGNRSDPIVSIRTNPSLSSPPTFVSATVLNSTSISLTWSYPADPRGLIQGYLIAHNTTNGLEMVENVTLTMINDMETQTFIFTNLLPFTYYSFQVAAYSFLVEENLFEILQGEYSTIFVELTNEDVPTMPLMFQLATLDSTSLTASWAPPVPANGIITAYTVYCRVSAVQFYPEQDPSGDNPFTVGATTDGSTLEANISGLVAFTNYSCYVTATTSAGEGGQSETVTERTSENVPSMPLMFQLAELSSISLTASWAPPVPANGIITAYTVYCRVSMDQLQAPSEDNPFTVHATTNGSTEVVVNNLVAFTNYNCYVTATTIAGEGGQSSTDTESTSEDVPSIPLVPALDVADSTSLTASWTPPVPANGIITAYTVYCRVSMVQFYQDQVPSDDSPFTVRATTDGNTLKANISNLVAFTNYSCYVTATNSAGESEQSNTVTERTSEDAPSAPVGVAASNTSSTSVNVSWDRPEVPNGIITNYLIAYYKTDEGGQMMMMNMTGDNQTQFELTQLDIYTSYTITVTAVTVSEGESSAPITVFTDEDVPGIPRNLTVIEVGMTYIAISWDPPATINGRLMNYIIRYQSTSSGNVSNTVSGESEMETITNLTPNTYYQINVSATTGAGEGEPNVTSAMTQVAPPPLLNVTDFPEIVPVINETSGGVTETSATIQFVIPFDAGLNGPVDRTLIIVQRQPSTNDTLGTYYESSRAGDGKWPPYPTEDILITAQRRKRQDSSESIEVSAEVGGTDDCGPEDAVCNGPLVPGAMYRVRYTLFSGNQSQDYPFFENATFTTVMMDTPSTPPLMTTSSEPSVTPTAPTTTTSPPPKSSSNSAAIAGAIIAVIAVVAVTVVAVVVGCIMYRRHQSGTFEVRKHRNGETLLPRNNGTNAVKMPFLGPSDPGIVPMSETKLTTSTTIQKYPESPQSNSRKIYLKDFPQYVHDMLTDTGYKFSEEYERVTEIGLDYSKEASLMTENRAKNRYTNILAYDHSRVKLSYVDDEPGSDYINGSYIPGYRMRRAYIATQGPLPATFDDFWRMVWEQNTHTIVMLTQLVERGRTKCHCYWPGTEAQVYGDIEVNMLSEKEEEDWTVREFELTTQTGKKSRSVRHFQYTAWPDHGVPEFCAPAIDFVRNVRSQVEVQHGPTVVHCSAGVGRTGCFIALDTLLQHISDHDWIDIFALACEMRQHRNHMIQTEAQYVFIHKTMIEVTESLSSYKGTSHFSGFSSMYINQFADDSTQMSDYYGDYLSEETHM